MNKKIKYTIAAAAISTLVGCGGGSDSPTSNDGINALLGTVSFTYKFNSSSTIFTDTVTFTASNINKEGTALSSRTTSGIAGKFTVCSFSPETKLSDGTYNYLCVITSSPSLGLADIFWFNVTNGTISGRYDFCIGPFSESACILDIATGPDGRVNGSVTSARPRQLEQSNSDATPLFDIKIAEENRKSEPKIFAPNNQEILVEQIRNIFQTLKQTD
jgi:hypothetical protein